MPADKLTEQVQRQICAMIQAGNWNYVAAEFVGIHRSTFYRWLQWGRNARTRGQYNKYRVFLEATEKAESIGEAIVVEKLRELMQEGDLAALRWWLVHRFPGRWGLQESRQQITGLAGGPVVLKVIRAVPRPDDDRDDPGHQEDLPADTAADRSA